MKVQLCTMDREELLQVTFALLTDRFQERKLSAAAAAQVLGVSVSTLNRWVDAGVVSPEPSAPGKERRFNLAYLLSLDVNELKKQYRYN